jgi:hypothetical protein
MKDGLGNWKDEETFKFYREAEIKHGRLAMMAIFGFGTASYVRFPFCEIGENADGWHALQPVGSGLAGEGGGAGGLFGVIVLLAAWIEIRTGLPDPSKEPGNFGDPADFASSAGGYTIERRNQELNHGRLAMSAFLTEAIVEYGTGLGPAAQLRVIGENNGKFLAAALLGWFMLSLGNTTQTMQLQAAADKEKALAASTA